jgi:hypothetical protein
MSAAAATPAHAEWVLDRAVVNDDEPAMDHAFLGDVGDAIPDSTWTVVNPSWIDFEAEEDYAAHALPPQRGHEVFRFTGAEFAARARDATVTFDWTDIAVAAPDGHVLLQLSCLASSRWQARTDDARLAGILREHRFAPMDALEWIPLASDHDDADEPVQSNRTVRRGLRTFFSIIIGIPSTAIALLMVAAAFDRFPTDVPGAIVLLLLAVAVAVGPLWFFLKDLR